MLKYLVTFSKDNEQKKLTIFKKKKKFCVKLPGKSNHVAKAMNSKVKYANEKNNFILCLPIFMC